MHHNINIIGQSFDFTGNGNFSALHLLLGESNKLIEKMHSDFNQFCFSSDFYDCVPLILANYSSDESGMILKHIWDGNGIGKVKPSALSQDEIFAQVDQQKSTSDQYHTLFVNNPNIKLTAYDSYFVHNEADVVTHACHLLQQYPATSDEYAYNLTVTFKNLIFHPEFNHLDKIKDGYQHFVGEIVNFMALTNNFEQSQSHVMQDIKNLNSAMLYTVCEEGGGKKKRKIIYDYEVGNEEHTINCEYHYKLAFKDGQNKKGHYYNDNRIYFGFIKAIEPMKVAIAHIGDHL